jgi:pimeloyl-ACP methyl ester carboxylesterase
MNPISIGRELASTAALMASYPLDCLTMLQIPRRFRSSRDTVILLHGNGGDRTNLLALSMLLRLAGFDNIGFFAYPIRQLVESSASQAAEMVAQADGGAGLHLIGHSLGGTIARIAAARSRKGRIRSLVTLGSPWSATQRSPDEVAIFGQDDPIVPPPPRGHSFPDGMFKRLIVLRNTGHLAVLHHDEAVRITLSELTSNRIAP